MADQERTGIPEDGQAAEDGNTSQLTQGPSLARYLQLRLERFQLPADSLSRQVAEHTRSLTSLDVAAYLPVTHNLAASIVSRSASLATGWEQRPELVWRYWPQEQVAATQWSNQTYPAGEAFPDTPFQTLQAEASKELPSTFGSYPAYPAEATGESDTSNVFPRPRTAPEVPPSVKPDTTSTGKPLANYPTVQPDTSTPTTGTQPAIRRSELTEADGTPAPAEQRMSTRRKIVKSSVEEPATPARPVEPATPEQAAARQTEDTVPPPQSAVPDTTPSGSIEKATVESALSEIRPIEEAPEASRPTKSRPVEEAPEASHPTESKPVEEAPEASYPTKSKPVEEAPEASRPTESTPVEEPPEVSRPTDSKPIEEAPEVSRPTDSKPVEETLAETSLPADITRPPATETTASRYVEPPANTPAEASPLVETSPASKPVTADQPASTTDKARDIINRMQPSRPELGRQTIRKSETPLARIQTQPISTAKSPIGMPIPSTGSPTTPAHPDGRADAGTPEDINRPADSTGTSLAQPDYGIYTYPENEPEPAATAPEPETGELPPSSTIEETSEADTSRPTTDFNTPKATSPATGYPRITTARPYIISRRPILETTPRRDISATRPAERSQSPAADTPLSPYLTTPKQTASRDIYESGQPAAQDGIENQPALILPELTYVTTGQLATPSIQTKAYQDSQPVSGLYRREESQTEQAETESVSSQSTTEEPPEETTPPDIDAIARDVYRILKRRLAREKERALGTS